MAEIQKIIPKNIKDVRLPSVGTTLMIQQKYKYVSNQLKKLACNHYKKVFKQYGTYSITTLSNKMWIFRHECLDRKRFVMKLSF